METNNNLKQLIISGVLGDGSLLKSGAMVFSCIHKDYMDFKKNLVKTISSDVTLKNNPGYKKDGKIYRFSLNVTALGKEYVKKSLSEVVEDIDELGLAMWLYDDGSLHKKSYFYNINTHAFSLEEQEDILIPLLNKFGIYPKIMPERKKDGRVFNYLFVSRYNGADKISKILKKYPIESYSYKCWSDEYHKAFDCVTSDFNSNGIREDYKMTKLINIRLKELKINPPTTESIPN
jgi:hypothetical protein